MQVIDLSKHKRISLPVLRNVLCYIWASKLNIIIVECQKNMLNYVIQHIFRYLARFPAFTGHESQYITLHHKFSGFKPDTQPNINSIRSSHSQKIIKR